MSDAVMALKEGHVLTLTLSRPEIHNRVNADLVDGIESALADASSDMDIKAIVLSAQGNVFSAGGDVKAMHARQGHFAGNSAEIRRYYQHGVQRLARAFNNCDVPVIAAVGGPAIGAGFDLALMCDIRIAARGARFAESFIKLGLVSAAGGAWLLPRLVGPSVAAELILTGRSIDVDEALRLGLINRVVEQDQLLDEAHSIAAAIAVHPAHSIRMNSRLLRESSALPLESSLELAASLQAIVQHTEDQHEAVCAAVEKRAATYVGR